MTADAAFSLVKLLRPGGTYFLEGACHECPARPPTTPGFRSPAADVSNAPSAPHADDVTARLQRICIRAVRTLSGSGAGVSLMDESGVHTAVSASDPATERIEELQFTLGEGPCIDAFLGRRPVLVPDLSDGATSRWPAYAPAAYAEGVRAVFAFPLQIGAARLGVLDVFRTSPGTLEHKDLSRALTLADVTVMLLLESQEHTAPDHDGLNGVTERRAELFQAQGMVMIQLGVTLAEALVRMRAHAYGEGRPLNDVAADIIARRIRFDEAQP